MIFRSQSFNPTSYRYLLFSTTIVSPLVVSAVVSKFAVMLVTFRQPHKGGHVASDGSNERRNAYKPKDLNCSYITYYQPSVRLVRNRTPFTRSPKGTRRISHVNRTK